MSGYWFIAPFFALLVLFAAFPLVFSLIVAFHEWNPSSPVSTMRYTGWWAFHYTFTDQYFWGSLWSTMRLALSSVLPQLDSARVGIWSEPEKMRLKDLETHLYNGIFGRSRLPARDCPLKFNL